MVLQKCYSGVTWVLRKRNGVVTVGFEWYSGGTTYSTRYGVTEVLESWCYSGVTVVLQWFYSGVTVVSQCINSVTRA
jgi:hypothetical protein